MISQIFILSARGDTIINRDFRSDLIKNTPELFFRKVKMAKGDCAPVFNIEGINFAYISVASLYIVATTRFNCSPSFILELLHRIMVVIKDFIGSITEEGIRKNFVMIYEILGKPHLIQMKSSILDILSSQTPLISNL
jgi:AP-4 complex subunit mu-1